MIETHAVSGLLDNLSMKDMILSLAGLVAILTGLGKFISTTINKLNLPIKDHQETYRKADVKTWVLRFFSISINLKDVPKLGRADLFFIYLLMAIFISSAVTFSYFGWKIAIVPKNWTALNFKPTKENFLITYDKASAHALKPSWSISSKQCSSIPHPDLARNNKISNELTNVICEILNASPPDKKLKQYILQFNKARALLIPILFLLILFMIWLSIGARLNVKYTKKLREHILKEQEMVERYT